MGDVPRKDGRVSHGAGGFRRAKNRANGLHPRRVRAAGVERHGQRRRPQVHLRLPAQKPGGRDVAAAGVGLAGEAAARFAGVGEAATREALHAWAEALPAARSGDGALPAFEELERLEGDDEMTTISEARLGKWFDDFRAENLERGIEQERARAIERSVARLRRQTMIRFGAAAAELVSDALRSGTTETELDRVDDRIVECGSADELLGRLSAGQSDSGNGSRRTGRANRRRRRDRRSTRRAPRTTGAGCLRARNRETGPLIGSAWSQTTAARRSTSARSAAPSSDGALPAFEESDRLEGDQKMTTISGAVEQGLGRGIEQERTRAIGTRSG